MPGNQPLPEPRDQASPADRTDHEPHAEGFVRPSESAHLRHARTRIDFRSHRYDLDAHLDEDLIGSALDIYRIDALLGRGAMGSVYLGWNERLERYAAVKVIAPELVRAEPHRLEMFQREARTAAQLHHPHVVSVHTLGTDRGYHFIEMEFVEGVSLGKMVAQHDRLPPPLATRLVTQVASGLVAAHSKGVLHCDVKPDNVMVRQDQVAKLGDFGLARALAGEIDAHRMVGTPFYMAPELFVGRENSPASDVYALGATYFCLLTGHVPFGAENLSELQYRHLCEPVPTVAPHITDLPASLQALLDRMLAKDPGERPEADANLLAELDSILLSLVSTRSLVAEAMRDFEQVEWRSIDDRCFEFLVTLSDGRRQKVESEVIDGEGESGPLMTFRTVCGPADPDHYAYVLRLNARLPFGAVSIHRHEGQEYFVMRNNLTRSTLDPEEIHATVLNLAVWADRLEHLLTGDDVH